LHLEHSFNRGTALTAIPSVQVTSVSQLTVGARFPFLDLKAQFATIRTEINAAILRVLESQHFILGPEVESMESSMRQYVGAEFAIGCASGSDALLLSLLAIGVDVGDEVITTPFTFVATAGAIARVKARPVFVDIDQGTFNLDPRQLEAAITSRTRAILPVHLFGLPADMTAIMRIGRDHKLPVIEDAAQAIGAWHSGKAVGDMGTMACFSFFPSNNLGGAGDGGMITTNSPELAERLRLLRVHGSRRRYEHMLVGINSRLDALQAAILTVKLRYLDQWTLARQQRAERYRYAFSSVANLHGLVQAPMEPPGFVHVYNQFVIRAQERDALREHLRQAGIPTEIYYPSPLHLQAAFAYLGYRKGDFPQAEAACEQVLALPIFPEMSEEQQQIVTDEITNFYCRPSTGRS
jgi:dTDP-4-amino-4,6-dideoxygalactose transaminase